MAFLEKLNPVFVGVFLIFASWSAPVWSECTDNETPAVVYQPSIDTLLVVSEASMERFRPYAKVRINIGNDGVPSFDGFLASTGNRTVDKAVQAWVMQFRFAPDICKEPRIRTVAVPVNLKR